MIPSVYFDQSISDTLAAICVQGWDAGKTNMTDFATTQTKTPMTGDFDWTQIETYLTPSDETKQAHILIFISGKGEVWFDDISVTPVGQNEALEAADQPLPGLFEARGKYEVRAMKDAPRATFLIPLPISYREQAPLTYELFTEPADKLASAGVYRDQPDNYIAEIVLKPLEAGDTLVLEWRSIVLCGARSFDDVPDEAPMPAKWPKRAQPWLKSSACVQCDDARIKQVATEIRGDSSDVLEIVQNTLERAGQIFQNQEGRCTNLDAVEALEKQGSCTSCANLVTALLRANNIPARMLAGYPTWSGPLQTHYIVEAYLPNYGWYPIESTMLRAPWQPYQQVEVSIIRPEYEDRSEQRPFVAGGVPYLSLTERPNCDGSIVSIGIVEESKRGCDHVATKWQAFPPETSAADWESLLKAAKKRWKEWLSSSPGLNKQNWLATPLSPAMIETTDPADLLSTLRE